jgi:DNA-binding Xre family transcriptional regulator
VTASFRQLLDRAAQKLGSQTALAAALGVDPTRISRLKQGRGDYSRLNFENCLKLAAILDEWPPDVLRAAGHARHATLFESLCGPRGAARSLKSSEWQLLQLWRDLSSTRQAAFLNLLKTEGGPAGVATSRREFSGAPRRSSGAK